MKWSKRVFPREKQSVETPPHEIYDQIARTAYELFERRGLMHGHDVEDWLEAERRITTQTGLPTL
jgi:hypothetical protein